MMWDFAAPPLPPPPAPSSRSSKAFSASGGQPNATHASTLPPPPMISISSSYGPALHKSQLPAAPPPPPPLISTDFHLMMSPKISSFDEASAPTLHNFEVGSQKSIPVTAVPDAGLVFPSKYDQLLMTLQEMNKDIRPSYAGSKTSVERLKRNITQARILIREALNESDYCNKFD